MTKDCDTHTKFYRSEAILKKKKELEDLLKKHHYQWDTFYLKCFYKGEEQELIQYRKHFFPREDYLELDNPPIMIPWEDVIEIKSWTFKLNFN